MARNPIQLQPGCHCRHFLGATAARRSVARRWRSYAGRSTALSAPSAPTPPAARSRAVSSSVIAVPISAHRPQGPSSTPPSSRCAPDFWRSISYPAQEQRLGAAAPLELGVSYNSAWKLKDKILQVIFERSDGEVLSGRVEIDDAYLGGERPGRRGRGVAAKFPFIAAVQTRDEERP